MSKPGLEPATLQMSISLFHTVNSHIAATLTMQVPECVRSLLGLFVHMASHSQVQHIGMLSNEGLCSVSQL